jgi:histidine triad (HIT) family protein
MNENCIFCKIIKGEIPAETVYETKNFIVIKDANPKTKGHSLVIPKQHADTFLNLNSSLYEEFLTATKSSAEKILKDTDSKGFHLLLNNGKSADQIVPHVHLHILPRKDNDGLRALA